MKVDKGHMPVAVEDMPQMRPGHDHLIIVSLSSNIKVDKVHMPIVVEDVAQRRPGHVCRSPVEASMEERAMAALGRHSVFGNVVPHAPSKGQ